jgi:hypothetical protein
MIENYRTQRVWRRFMANDIVQRGLQRAGFLPADLTKTGVALAPAAIEDPLAIGSGRGSR